MRGFRAADLVVYVLVTRNGRVSIPRRVLRGFREGQLIKALIHLDWHYVSIPRRVLRGFRATKERKEVMDVASNPSVTDEFQYPGGC